MTSAIRGMSVANVRKCLGEVRRMDQEHTERRIPLYITQTISNGMTVQDFCLEFVKGQHEKRHKKNKT